MRYLRSALDAPSIGSRVCSYLERELSREVRLAYLSSRDDFLGVLSCRLVRLVSRSRSIV